MASSSQRPLAAALGWLASAIAIAAAEPGIAGALPQAALPHSAIHAISGRVFLDTNRNGSCDPGEKGIAGCLVSDEESISKSDAAGRFELPSSAGAAVVFVVNPPGTWPSGPWWHPLAGREINREIDFPLLPQDQSGPLYFVQGTDPHLQPSAVPLFRRYLEHVNALPVPVQFVVHTGDLVVDSGLASMERARELFDLYEAECKNLRAPLRNIMGNHDIAGVLNPKLSGNEPGFGKALFRERFGPATYAFRFGPYHFVALDGTQIEDRKLLYGLTEESANWAIRYLAELRGGEPVILLIHEPMFPEVAGVRQPDTPLTRPHEARLRDALQGHKVVMTLAGHVHSRGESIWAGAPHLTGGAISYAWHGLQPFPPAPCGYVLFRLENGREEHVHLDWAEGLSIDIANPPFAAVVRGKPKISGVVADPQASVNRVECALEDLKAPARIARRGGLATAFESELDITGMTDGVHDLLVTAHANGKSWTERQPVVVLAGKGAPFLAQATAQLTFRTAGKPGPGLQVTCNGQPVAVRARPGADLSGEVSPEHLRGLNEIVIRSGADAKTIRSVSLTYQGRSFRDVRFAPGVPRPVTAPLVSWIDLRYQEMPPGPVQNPPPGIQPRKESNL